MALCIFQSTSLIFFMATLFVRIYRHECKQSELTLWPVDSCPGNLSEVKAATLRLNCAEFSEFRKVYHCLPTSNLSLLVEFCYDGLSGLIEKGNCMVLENKLLNNYPCTRFTKGCPDVPYYSKNMFTFPACIRINKQNGCYLADPNCPTIISVVDATNLPTVNMVEEIAIVTNDVKQIVLVQTALAVVLNGFIIFMGLCYRCRRRGGNRNNDRCVHVEIHVNADIENYTKLENLIEAVAKILECDRQSIEIVGIRRENSFIIVLEVEKKLAHLLSRKTPQELMVLAEFDIDTINMDRNAINIADMSLSHYLIPIAVNTSSITVPGVTDIYHISSVTSDRLWVSDYSNLLQIDSSGHEIEKMRIEIDTYPLGGLHAITGDGELLFIDRNHNRVQKMTSDRTITTFAITASETLRCIHSSRINGDILVGCGSVVMRYDRSGQIRDIMKGWRHKIDYPTYITENKNGDIWVSDMHKKAVVAVMDKSGQYRFSYKGQKYQSDFEPRGICTDILGQVLVCDIYNLGVHLLDQDGQFLRLLLKKEHGLHSPVALCVDDKHNLYLGQMGSNTITVYKYLQEAEKKET